MDQVARVVAGAYDASNGGFGNQPKFPNYPVIQFVSHLARTTGEEFYRVMLEKTLDRMADSPLNDKVDGGFFRHCAASDWGEPQWEKLLEDNVGLAQAYLDAGFLLDRDDYCLTASQTIDYIIEHLFDGAVPGFPGFPGFHGSQGAHSEYFSLPLESRREQSRPPVDPSCYTSGNAQAVVLLLDAAWRLERPELGETALEVLDALDNKAESGDVGHEFDGSGMHVPAGFLLDWANLLNAHLSAYAFTNDSSYLDRATALANGMLDRFFDQQNGGFFDIEQDDNAIGHLEIREKPLPDNAAAALALLKLHQVTRNDDYRQVAETTLSAFVQSYREYGEFAAPYGLAIHHLKHSPVEVTVEGRHRDPATTAMLKAAHQLSCPHLEVKPISAEDTATPALAHVCLDTVCLPPVSDPGELAEAVENMAGPGPFGDNPLENIFERFPGA
ncbi:MAG: thioredoxin domain-containing protein [Chloroflexi bacterium]|nr:thioredoxin domain-containing protein [Chloroflexota bacterium]